ncbi:uncharacterized protein LOC143785132 [Ranitomeya variabilis]|uniref:uncharacterized protein LOC143785132 n=1 Tax=Ranitomeya variabilis TaxID=490064 RepID=UPI0040577C5E
MILYKQGSRKATGKTKNRECALCKNPLAVQYRKDLCADCINKTIQEETPNFTTSLKAIIQAEIKDSLKLALSEPRGGSRRASTESDTSQRQGSHKTSRSPSTSPASVHSSDSSSDSDSGGRPCLPTEDVDKLVKAVRSAMGLKEEKTPRSLEDVMFGGLEERRKRTFPVNAKIKALIEKEWKRPEKMGSLPSSSKRRYPFENKDSEPWEKIPKIDGAVAKCLKKSSLPLEDSGVLKDPLDKKADGFLRHIWEASAGGLKPAIAGTCTARALMVWLQQIEDQLRDKVPRSDILANISLVQGAAAFLADSSADSARLTARAASLSNAARRALWLKGCPGDLPSKHKLCSIPCDGQLLFGKKLEEILEHAGDKKKGFPNIPKESKKPFFRRRRFNRGRPPGERKNWDFRDKRGSGYMFKGPSTSAKKSPQ